ncbi:DUF2330 domain-containing protein [Streptomyces sp. NPDC101249]|uniref:DUF2330 domain-containing protein n=2 Tax=unclassified Streptomyces TaxID=2593676 RepID=UPI0037F62E50
MAARFPHGPARARVPVPPRPRAARSRARALAVACLLLAVQLGSLLAPAWACGCGVVPEGGRVVTVAREESAVRWDGREEQIVMSLTVAGDAGRAAWVVPVPHRATVGPADPALFTRLAAATAPVRRTRHHFWPRDDDWPLVTGGARSVPGPPPFPGVGVVGRQRLGALDVARLTATDPAALERWLARNGFTLPPRLAAALEPYVARRWEYVAVRVAPGAGAAPLRGTLDPLRLVFRSARPVYPMRLSRLAREPQSLALYVLAAHRMEPVSAIGGERPRTTFAGRVTDRSGPLAELARGTPYLTAVHQEFPSPASIDDDHVLRGAAADTPVRQVVYEDRLRTLAGLPAWLLTLGGALLLALAAAAGPALRRARDPAARTSVSIAS